MLRKAIMGVQKGIQRAAFRTALGLLLIQLMFGIWTFHAKAWTERTRQAESIAMALSRG